MTIVHDDDLTLLVGNGAVSESLACTGHSIDIFTLPVTRISPTRCSVKSPPKLQTSDPLAWRSLRPG